MALDCALLEGLRSGSSPPTIRFYQWSTAAVSVGRFQDVRDTLNVAYLAAERIPVVRRPTGGRGVLHGGDLTVSITLPAAALGADGQSVVRSHARIMAAIAGGLRHLGYACAIGGQPVRPTTTGGDCFAAASPADLATPSGVKIAGGAQRRIGGAILQQISIPHRHCGLPADRVFRGLHREPIYMLEGHTIEELQDALAQGFSSALGIEPAPRDYSCFELRTARNLEPGIPVDLGELM